MSLATSTDRVFNFSPGPAVLPLPVLEQIQSEMLSLPGCGASILEISHRSKAFLSILDATKDRLRRLIGIPNDYDILFLQGGSRLQFSMIPMNLLRGTGKSADYVHHRFLGQIRSSRSGQGRPDPRRLGREGDQLQPLADRRRIEVRSASGLCLHHVQ